MEVLLDFLLTPEVRNAEIGSIIGFTTGYALKKMAKFIIVLLGLGFTLLESLQVKGFITVNYDSLESLVADSLGQLSAIQDILSGLSVSLGTSFLAGLLIGLMKA